MLFKIDLQPKLPSGGQARGGLACANFLAQAHIQVTIFDRSSEIGGIPNRIIPRFRISQADILADINRIKALGVQFSLNAPPVPDWDALQTEGYTALVLATGATRGKSLELNGEGIPQIHALAFLERAHEERDLYPDVKSVAIVGGGNTAMDAARVAIRLPGKPAVHILYRRSLDEMPADREEFQAALADGALYHPLCLPEAIVKPGLLRIRNMQLGQKDEQGRRQPEPTDKTWDMACDLIISAIGELPDPDLFTKLGIPILKAGPKRGLPQVDELTMESQKRGVYVIGDARRGPASIISAEADGRDAAFAIIRSLGKEPEWHQLPKSKIDREALSRRGELLESLAPDNPDFAEREAERCLSCGTACLRCVEVCPNRANIAIPIPEKPDSPVKQELQIIHIDDLCNQCGNCGFFCPYDGNPYEEKPTLFSSTTTFEQSTNPGFVFLNTGKDHEKALQRPTILYRLPRDRSSVEADQTRSSQGTARMQNPDTNTGKAKIEELDVKALQARAATDPMLFLAWQILSEHPYLLSPQNGDI